MKNLFLTTIIFISSIILGLAQQQPAQTPVAPEPITDKPNHEGWINDAQKAAKLSQQTGAPVLLFFTGSDWCGWCVRLHNEVLSTTEFKAWAKEKGIILLEVDFPRRTAQSDALKRQNAGLQQQFQIRGYPTIYIVKGDKYTKMGYEAGGPKAWIAKAESKIQL